ncbi:hypothetical protein GWI33_001675 [Rhynchophorus ferrugineus]|uniref:Uncharacterized protein n=1 Tax=Rhynchophorus ferrugineus TaxID=354439 RepID=A0A834MND5_RHYFE|nr:hypothetical protein GWI33_001675 [Rhynchophorus ferrugineus]
MGARHSKRSVDITTTPKKGEEGAAVIEGEEGKLEKIAEPDLKVTTNGTVHNEIELADKEASKDDTEDKEKDTSKAEIKENGLPEEPSNAVDESQKAEATTPVENGETEKTPEKETAEQKVEETSDQKKKKDKKKKWSFRSISFSKKDKSKPSKESGDKNGEVKEVAEECIENVSGYNPHVDRVSLRPERVANLLPTAVLPATTGGSRSVHGTVSPCPMLPTS